MKDKTGSPLRRALFGLACVTLIAGCDGSSNENPNEHGGTTIDTAGRIAVTENGAASLRLHAADSGNVELTHQLDHTPSGLYTSPGGRYVVVTQGPQNQVQFVDGGIWQEDHGDHSHDYQQASKLLTWKLAGIRPSHYDLQEGKQASIFFDGSSSAMPAQGAGMRLITDTSIGAGATVAALDLTDPIHGFAEPVDDKLLSVHRANDAVDTLPTHIQLYLKNGAGYAPQRLLTTRCDKMHGSYSSGAYTAAGCADGVLLVKHVSATDVTDQKISTPSRVSTLLGHPNFPGHFIAYGNDGTAPAPVTTRFYALSGDSAAATEIIADGWVTGNLRRAHGYDRSGTLFHILDDQGTLIVLVRQDGGWVTSTRIPGAIPAMPMAAPWPVITTNGARDEIYITDPVAQQLVVVNTQNSSIITRRDLGYVPSNALWIGISR